MSSILFEQNASHLCIRTYFLVVEYGSPYHTLRIGLQKPLLLLFCSHSRPQYVGIGLKPVPNPLKI